MKQIVIVGDARYIDNIVKENRVRVQRGFIKISGDTVSTPDSKPNATPGAQKPPKKEKLVKAKAPKKEKVVKITADTKSVSTPDSKDVNTEDR